MLAPYVKNCTAIFNELANILKIVLSPLPRYLTSCPDPEHALKRSGSDLRRTVISGTECLGKASGISCWHKESGTAGPKPPLVDGR
jgi:hypothetical protein